MTFIECNFLSKALLVPTTVYVSLPFPYFNPIGEPETFDQMYAHKREFKTLYFLHGAFADATLLLKTTRAEEYAERLGLALVAASVGSTFYADPQHGPAYWTFISEELPRFVQSIFPVSRKREDNFAAGFSMGGYGAFKLALNKPEAFGAAISFSGVLDSVEALADPLHPVFDVDSIYGGMDELRGSESDLFAQLAKLVEQGRPLPRLYQTCGTEDDLLPMNIKFRDYAASLSVPLTYEEGPGNHTTDFVDAFLPRAMEWAITGQVPQHETWDLRETTSA